MKKHFFIIKILILTVVFINNISCALMNHMRFYNALKRNPIINAEYSRGKILIVPLAGIGDIGLYNKEGFFEKIYSTNIPTFYGEIIDNDNILVIHFDQTLLKNRIAHLDKLPDSSFNIIGTTGLISVYNKKGKLKLSFKDASLHHDISIKSPTRIFALSWKAKKYNISKFKNVTVVEDSIIEIDLKMNKIIKRWPLKNYFSVFEKNSINYPMEGVLNCSYHANSIDYIKENPINGNEAILVTMRNFDNGKVALIDLETGNLLWESKTGALVFPHDARFTEEKTITLFNNGSYKKMHSQVFEIDIKNNKILWKYDRGFGNNRKSGFSKFRQFRMFSPYLSGVYKTKKGYLVTVGNQGKIFEVSKDKKIVWELPASGSFTNSIEGTLSTELFKVKQYK